jgi:Protein of unknown function (DUF1573)
MLMRKIILIWALVAMFGSGCGDGTAVNSVSSAQKEKSTGTSELIFREYQHDFGKVSEGEKLSYTFIFNNKGTSDLIISSATTTCGCTVPKYDKKPIAPGANGNMEVVFDTSGRSGMQTKIITVKSNASVPVVLIKITAEVVTIDK